MNITVEDLLVYKKELEELRDKYQGQIEKIATKIEVINELTEKLNKVEEV